MKKSTEVTVCKSGYLKLQEFNMAEALQEEMTGLELAFDKIKVPSGGSINFEMPTDDPDAPDSVKEFSGVIIYHHPIRVYYKGKYNGEKNPPDCCSYDAVTGTGDPGGICSKCPMNQFGTALDDGTGKGCKDRRRIYVLREDEVFPLLLSLPTGSLKNLTAYITRLLTKQKRTNMVVTKFSLKKAVNAGGLEYSQAVFSAERDLTEEEQNIVSMMAGQIKAIATSVGFDDDVSYAAESSVSDYNAENGEIVEPLR